MHNLTQAERDALNVHRAHRRPDVTTYDSERRELYCFGCNRHFSVGPVALAITEPLESAALVAQKAVRLATVRAQAV